MLFPKSQDWELLRVWESTEVERKEERSLETEQRVELDLNGPGTKAIM